jgi:hypothetical protein
MRVPGGSDLRRLIGCHPWVECRSEVNLSLVGSCHPLLFDGVRNDTPSIPLGMRIMYINLRFNMASIRFDIWTH